MKTVLDVEAYRRGKIVVHEACSQLFNNDEKQHVVRIKLDTYRTLYFNSQGYQVDELMKLMSEPTYLLLL